MPSKLHLFGLSVFLCGCMATIILSFSLHCLYVWFISEQPHWSCYSVVKILWKILKGSIIFCIHILLEISSWFRPKSSRITWQYEKKSNNRSLDLKHWKEGEIKLKNFRKLLVMKWKYNSDVHFITLFYRGRYVDGENVNHQSTEIIMKPDCGVTI